jgi:hypothetical protein
MNPLFREIPYLNGGLFRETIPEESNYSISDEGIELIVSTFFGKYKFGSNQQINPDMLGYIFEKTINYISGQGTNKQKEEGAYYTPDDIVGFIIEKTLTPVIFQKMIEGLKNAGWRDIDLKDFDSIETLLTSNNRPKNRIHVRKMIESLDTIKVLDPACGSGHFLTAMLSRLLRVKENLMRSVDEDVDRYHLKKQIITRNIYGVDIDENGVEIARLRLWLSLLEELQEKKRIEPLPNIDFNIVAGNSLIGWLNENLATHPFLELLQDPTIQSSLSSIASNHPKEVAEVEKLLEKKTLSDSIRAYENLIRVYSSESGESAVRIREAIAGIRKKLYEVYNDSYNSFIHENSNLSKMEIAEFSKLVGNLRARNPFHWKVDFGAVFDNKGFDVVVGNPPYIEDGNYNEFELKVIECTKLRNGNGRNSKKQPLLYSSGECGNTHAYFIERAMKLTKEDGIFGHIVPISLVSTERMDSIREFIHTNSSEVHYYNFDDRPAKIFSGLEHCRSTIVIAKKGRGTHVINTSKYHRWHTRDRAKFLKNLKTISWTLKSNKGVIPKIGTKVEKEILEVLEKKAKGKTVIDSLKPEGTTIWYHNAPQYWIHAHPAEYLPKVEYYNRFRKNEQTGEITPLGLKETKASTQYKPLTLGLEDSKILNGLINSSLFYWWFTIWSDGRHLLNSQIEDFPFNITECTEETRGEISLLVDELMESYDKKSNVRSNVRDGGRYCIVIKEIIPKRSKSIIDKIDDSFAEYFGFTEKQKEFITTFDLKFRIQEE